MANAGIKSCSENGEKSDREEQKEVILALAIWVFLPDGYDGVADVRGLNADIPEGADERLWRDFAAETGRVRGVDVPGRRGGHWRMCIPSRRFLSSPL